MGVLGLMRYIEENGLYKVVDLQEIAKDIRSRNVGEPVIAVDGCQCVWYLYGNLDLLHGGQYKQFRESCEKFVKRFHDVGIRLSFFFDGVPEQEEMPMWLKKKEAKAKKISNFIAKLRAAHSKGDTETSCSFLPEGVVPCAMVTFKHIGCEVRLSTADCNFDVADFATGNRSCIGVLSNDTGLLMYVNIPCLFPFSNLEMGQKVTGLCIRSSEIALHLGIQVEDLPVLASLMGNDIISEEALSEVHTNLRQLYRPKPDIELVAELLKKTPRGDLKMMCQAAFSDKWREGMALVLNGVHHYRYTVSSPSPALSKWDKVLQVIQAKHVFCEIPGYMFTVMKCRIMRCSEVLEVSPPTALIGRPMRVRMYAVLLWDSGPGPFQVTEYILTEAGEVRQDTVEVKKRLPMGDYHPGLLGMWSDREDHRWLIFTWVISPNKDISALCGLSPQHLVVPAAVLSYLYCEAKILTREEVRTFLLVAVSIKSFSSHQLSSLHVTTPTERAIYLTTLFVRTVLHVLDAAVACGLSFPRPGDCQLDAYFDSKLFHHIYSKSQNTTDPRALTTWDTSCEITFRHLMKIIE